mgnify:CR=1 FL=1
MDMAKDCTNEATMSETKDTYDGTTPSVLQRFVVLLYDRTSDCADLDSARQQLFTKKSQPLELLPPTRDTFEQHVKRAAYQAIHTWSHCLKQQMPTVDPGQWGRTKQDDQWVPLWMTLLEVAVMCSVLVQC